MLSAPQGSFFRKRHPASYVRWWRVAFRGRASECQHRPRARSTVSVAPITSIAETGVFAELPHEGLLCLKPFQAALEHFLQMIARDRDKAVIVGQKASPGLMATSPQLTGTLCSPPIPRYICRHRADATGRDRQLDLACNGHVIQGGPAVMPAGAQIPQRFYCVTARVQ